MTKAPAPTFVDVAQASKATAVAANTYRAMSLATVTAMRVVCTTMDRAATCARVTLDSVVS